MTHTLSETLEQNGSLTASIGETMADKAAREAERVAARQSASLTAQPEEASSIGATLVSFVRAHPIPAVLAAVAVGVLVSKLARRR